MAKKFYVVWVGREEGVFDDWDLVAELVDGFPGAKYKSFSSREKALEAYRSGPERDEMGALLMGMRRREGQAGDYMMIAEVDKTAWAVDAACSGNPGPTEYQCIDLATGKQVFHFGPIPGATNNIGEFLAIVHALALMWRKGERHPLYSDSRTAISWVANGAPRTKLERTASNRLAFDLLDRACVWLNTHSFRVPLLKWDTEHWGEIPADFGRKK